LKQSFSEKDRGIYTTIVICRGFHIDHLVDILPIIPDQWIIRDAHGITFACPSTIKYLDFFDSYVDNDDISQGFVAIDKLTKCADLSPNHFDVSDDEQNQLESIRHYYKEIMLEADSISEISNVIVEYRWSTIGWMDDKLHLQQVLYIK
jgi:hypothetical protein